FLNYVNVRRANVYVPDDLYEETIHRLGGIDFLISGIGINGHVAFNEPGSAFDSRTRLVELATSTVELIRPMFSEGELPEHGITVGLATIFEARSILLLASGANKANILARALTGTVSPEVPASILQRHPNVTTVADEAAASVYR